MAGRGPQSFKKRQKEQQRERSNRKSSPNAESDNKATPAEIPFWGEKTAKLLGRVRLFPKTSVPPNSLCVNGGDCEFRVHPVFARTTASGSTYSSQ